MNRCIHGQKGGCERCAATLRDLTAGTTLWKVHDDTEAREAHMHRVLIQHGKDLERRNKRR